MVSNQIRNELEARFWMRQCCEFVVDCLKSVVPYIDTLARYLYDMIIIMDEN